MRLRTTMTALAMAAAAVAGAMPAEAAAPRAGGNNDAACRPSAAHPNPVIVLHGLGATYYEDINVLQSYLALKGYCTFSLTYGDYDGMPLIGGLRPIDESLVEIDAFVNDVLATTGAAKVDIVGHSEGGFMSLYVTKFGSLAGRVGNIAAIAPPTHGTDFGKLVTLGDAVLGRELWTAISTGIGAQAVKDLVVGGPAVTRLNTGPIAQPGVAYTIIQSRYDEMVTPVETAFVREPGVKNLFVQDSCPFDPVGHIGEAYDYNVWRLVENALDPANARPIAWWSCVMGSPG